MESTTELLGRFAAALDEVAVAWVPVDRLVLEGSPRRAPREAGHVEVLAGAADRLPPIVVHRETLRVIDGVHRVHALRARGRRRIAVRFFRGSAQDAFLLGVVLNVRGGKPLTLAERRSAAERIVTTHPTWSDRAIASVTGLSAKTVAGVRGRTGSRAPRSTVRVGRDGRTRPLSAASGRLKASRIMTERPDATLREVAAECGISLGTAHDVRIRLRKGQHPVPARAGVEPPTQPPAKPPRKPQTEPPRQPPAVGRRGVGPAPDGRDDGFAVVRERFQSMSREPSLKYSPQGRLLLQLLKLSTMDREEWLSAVRAVPPHWRGTLGELARFCAAEWQRVADETEGVGRRTA